MKNYLLRNFYLLSILGLFFVLACKKLPNEGIPSYIKLVRPILETSPEQGAAVHSFSDIWIESEGNNLGAYEYPLTFAAYLAGSKKTICNPGVWHNGNGQDRRIHPAIEVFDTTYNFIQKDTVEIQPIFRYKENVDFIYVEDFEATNNFSNTVRTELTSPENQTGKAATIILSASENKKTAQTISPIPISVGQRVYLEFSFKSENYGGFGFRSVSDQDVILRLGTFSPFSKWTTVYYNLTNFVNVTKEGTYEFYMETERGDLTGDSKTYIDNFKILQF